MTKEMDNFGNWALGVGRWEFRISLTPQLPTPNSQRPAPRHRGFSFLEILFSVIIIGIGFVMIAAVFPVAIAQTQSNVNEAAAVALSRDALRYIQESTAVAAPTALNSTSLSGYVATFPLQPTCTIPSLGLAAGDLVAPTMGIPGPLPTVEPLPTALLTGLNPVLSGDRRFAWYGLYRRDYLNTAAGVSVPAPYAQVWIVTAQNTAEGQTNYGSAPLVSAANFFPSTGNGVQVTLNAAASTVTFVGYNNQGPIRDGAFILVTDYLTGALTASDSFYSNTIVGWSSKLGVQVAGAAAPTWYLLSTPPISVPVSSGGPQTVSVFVLGKPYIPANTTLGTPASFTGPAQDVTCTTGFVRVNN